MKDSLSVYLTWNDAKKDLEKHFQVVANHPEYINRTYKGAGFYKALVEWADCWVKVDEASQVLKDSHTDAFWNKLGMWIFLSHMEWPDKALFDNNVAIPFECPEFLDKMFDITHQFIFARTEEEESKVLDICYRLEKNKDSDGYLAKKFVWLTEENTGVKSGLLPGYSPYDLTDSPKASSKDLQRIYKAAIKKGILVNNKK